MKELVLGNIEQEVLSTLWDSKTPLNVRAVLEKLDKKYAYTTVMTVMSRMEKKEMLKREQKGKSFVYSCTENRANFTKKHLSSIYKCLCNTYSDEAITQFVHSIKDNTKSVKTMKKCLCDDCNCC